LNLPNRITFLRILLIPLILIFMLPLPQLAFLAGWNRFVLAHGNLVALFVFSLAAVTDLVDGTVARRLGLVTNMGKFLDPIADKMLVISVMAALVQQGRLHALAIILVIFREFIVTGIRLAASGKGIVIAASNLGKTKTVTQMSALIVLLGENLWINLTQGWIPAVWIRGFGDLAIWLSVLLTLVSGLDYAIRNRFVWNE
jgi:CDP-diacylglycerol---glycerol-3-phosphate 3-phosphatidyltransferase